MCQSYGGDVSIFKWQMMIFPHYNLMCYKNLVLLEGLVLCCYILVFGTYHGTIFAAPP
ncbi:hypothetical protein HPP92_008335 [Vanilla planifolia]|uniref:Uncharacterized protein n=1 Tax=Vanilla planifolia TaxID=51239 RepID=A0A835RDW7_VANPL|nr:hypothetical protein HPP92_008335 [Vanilla planifolia]